MLNIEMIKKNLCKPKYFSYGLFFMICQQIYLINLNHLLHFKNQTNLRHMIWCNLLQEMVQCPPDFKFLHVVVWNQFLQFFSGLVLIFFCSGFTISWRIHIIYIKWNILKNNRFFQIQIVKYSFRSYKRPYTCAYQ